MVKEHLTDEDYAIARSYGIDDDNTYNRFYTLGWDKQKSITTPLGAVRPGRKRGIWYDYKGLAESNGITYSCFCHRVKQGLHPSRAATLQRAKKGQIQREVSLYGRIPRIPNV